MKNSLSRLQRNHGLEHATMHLLSQRFPGKPIAGHSDLSGFWILGEFSPQEVTEAAQEALVRMRAGQSRLSVHPNCGTNLVTSGIFAAIAAWFALASSPASLRGRLERLPLAIALATFSLALSRPLGPMVQERVTTSGRPGTLELVEVRNTWRGSIHANRVVTRG
jgi:hypothetical protein